MIQGGILMANQSWRRNVIAALVGLGAWAGLAKAGDTVIVVPASTANNPTVLTVPASHSVLQPGEPRYTPQTEPNSSEDPDKLAPRGYSRLHDWLQNRSRRCGCWGDYNSDFYCSTCWSEYVFIFGSCRQFWREPCLKTPPPSPFGPAYDCLPDSPCRKR
jgi:hypothetical protein